MSYMSRGLRETLDKGDYGKVSEIKNMKMENNKLQNETKKETPFHKSRLPVRWGGDEFTVPCSSWVKTTEERETRVVSCGIFLLT